jgi:hypothetical protein
MAVLVIWASALYCGQVAPDPAYLREAVSEARCLESTFLEPVPPSTVTLTDRELLRKLAGAMTFGVSAWSTTAAPREGHLFMIRIFSPAPEAAPLEFTLVNRRGVVYGPDNRASALLATPEFHDLLYLEHQKNTARGHLTFLRAYSVPPGRFVGTGNALAISRDGGFLYIADGGRHALHRFIRRPQSGFGALQARYQRAEEQPRLEDAEPHAYLTTPVALALSPDDRFLYLVATFSHAVTVFYCDPQRGPVRVAQVVRSNHDDVPDMQQPESIALSPDGRHAYVVASVSRRLLTFDRNQRDGTLTFVEGHPEHESPRAVAISPDGKHVYILTFRTVF